MSKRRTALSSILFATAVALAQTAYAQDGSHPARPFGVVIEHGDVVLAAGGGGTTGYLHIWNGTDLQVELVAIESDAFARVELRRAGHPSDRTVPIPGHSELAMRKDGIHFVAEPKEMLTAGGSVRVAALLADGSRLEIGANILPPGARPVDHRHGFGDR